MTEALVDDLEVVEVHEEHADVVAAAFGAGERVLDPVDEQCPVRQVGQRVVQRQSPHLGVELLALGDVAHGEHQSADTGDTPHVGGDDLEVAPAPVCMAHMPFDDGGRGPVDQQHRELLRVVGLEEIRQGSTVQGARWEPQHPFGRWRLVAHDTRSVDDHDGVGRVVDQHPEAGFAALVRHLTDQAGDPDHHQDEGEPTEDRDRRRVPHRSRCLLTEEHRRTDDRRAAHEDKSAIAGTATIDRRDGELGASTGAAPPLPTPRRTRSNRGPPSCARARYRPGSCTRRGNPRAAARPCRRPATRTPPAGGPRRPPGARRSPGPRCRPMGS